MLYNLINTIKSQNLRRVASGVTLLLFPLVILVAFIVGTLFHIGASVKDFAKDLRYLGSDIALSFRHLVNGVRTGVIG